MGTDIGVTAAFYSARPVILLEGTEDEALGAALISVVAEETTAGLYRCELTFGNWGPSASGGVDYLFFDRSKLDFGKGIAVQMGSGTAQGTVFTGRIMALEGRYFLDRAPELVVLADDKLQDLRMNRRTRTFEDVSDSDVISQVISGAGLTASVSVTGPAQHKVIAQVNQSDLAFIRERARAVDAEVWIEDTTVHVQSRADRNAGEVTLTYGERLREFSALADLANQRTAVTVTGWDVATKQAISSEAASTAISSELGSLTSGVSILAAIGDRKEQIAHAAPFTDDEAKYVAEAAFRRLARRFVTGSGISEGDARIKVGASVTLDGLGTLFDGKYYVSEARHLFDAEHGYRTQFRVERPGIGTGA